jgi:transcriptional regulator with XRE-family HTH domain
MDYIRRCFSQNLKVRRAILRISQEELAELSGVSAGYIANIETGRSFPSTKVWLKLSETFHVEPAKLVENPEKVDTSYSKEEFLNYLDRAMKMFVNDGQPGGSRHDD